MSNIKVLGIDLAKDVFRAPQSAPSLAAESVSEKVWPSTFRTKPWAGCGNALG